MDGKGIDQAREGKNPQYLLLRRGQQQLTTSVPGLPPPTRQRGHPAGIDELQACQVDDDIALAGRGRRERNRDARGVCYVKHPAQRDDNLTVAFAGTQIHADHGAPSRFGSKAGSRPGGSFASFTMNLTLNAAMFYPGSAC